MSPRLTIKVSGMGFTLSHWWCLRSWRPPTSSPWFNMDMTELSVWASMPQPPFVSGQFGYRYTRIIPTAKYSFEFLIFNSRFFAIASNNLLPILDKCFSYSITRTLPNQTHLNSISYNPYNNDKEAIFDDVEIISFWAVAYIGCPSN